MRKGTCYLISISCIVVVRKSLRFYPRCWPFSIQVPWIFCAHWMSHTNINSWCRIPFRWCFCWRVRCIYLWVSVCFVQSIHGAVPQGVDELSCMSRLFDQFVLEKKMKYLHALLNLPAQLSAQESFFCDYYAAVFLACSLFEWFFLFLLFALEA